MHPDTTEITARRFSCSHNSGASAPDQSCIISTETDANPPPTPPKDSLQMVAGLSEAELQEEQTEVKREHKETRGDPQRSLLLTSLVNTMVLTGTKPELKLISDVMTQISAVTFSSFSSSQHKYAAPWSTSQDSPQSCGSGNTTTHKMIYFRLKRSGLRWIYFSSTATLRSAPFFCLLVFQKLFQKKNI